MGPPAASVGGCEHRRGADEAAEQEGLRAVALAVAIHATILGVILCALGDLMLDLIVRIERPLARGDDTPAVTRAGAGGQAANVAAWAAALGAQSRLIAKWGGDTPGRLVAAEVGARRVEVLGPMAPGRNGVVVSVVEPNGERSMLSDPGVAAELRPEDLQPEWLSGCDALYVSGYALLRDPVRRWAAAARAVREEGGVVSVDLSTWSSIRSFGADRFRDRIAELEPDVVFATELELEALGGAPDAADDRAQARAGRRRRQTRDEETGHEAARGPTSSTRPARETRSRPGFLVGGIELGLEAAARCVSQAGRDAVNRGDRAGITRGDGARSRGGRYEPPYDFYDGKHEPGAEPRALSSRPATTDGRRWSGSTTSSSRGPTRWSTGWGCAPT